MALPVRRGGALERRRSAFGTWDPFSEFENVWSEMGRLLGQAATPVSAAPWMPLAEEDESEDAYIIRAELPGLPAENVNVELEGNELCITGELSEEERGKVLSRRTGRFAYRTNLPGSADSENIQADLTNGILTVRVPKAAEEKRRKIEIGGHRETSGENK
jgi:HSP20 family protein